MTRYKYQSYAKEAIRLRAQVDNLEWKLKNKRTEYVRLFDKLVNKEKRKHLSDREEISPAR
jgi:hypothetical protein